MLGGAGMSFVPVRRPKLARRLLYRAEAALQLTGAAWAYSSARRPASAVIINYHSVPDDHAASWIDPANAVPPELFESHVAFLSSRRRVLGYSELVRMVERREAMKPGSVAITFDDGYLDVLRVAAPILDRYRVPAIVFLPTGYISRGEPHWIDRLYTAFRRRTRPLDDLRELCAPASPAEPPAAYARLAERLLSALPPERAALLAAIDQRLAPEGVMPRLTMTWDDVRELRDRFPMVEFGVHTVEHTDLASCPPEIARWELTQSMADLQREIGRRADHFSFPYNRSSPEARAAAAATGYRSSLANGHDPLVRPTSDLLALPRIEPPATLTMLRFMTGGAYPDLPRMLFAGRA